MTIGTRIDSTLGPVSSNDQTGLTVEKNASNKGFAPFAVDSITTVVSSSTFDAAVAGVNTVSASSGLTGTMPKASDVPGSTLIFRQLCTNVHILTGSLETGGTKVFVSQISGNLGVGATLTIPGTVGASVLLQSDGKNFHVLSYSGSVTLS